MVATASTGRLPRPEVVLSEHFVSVEPGQAQQLKLRVKNTGTRVANLSFSMIEESAAAAWTQIAPPSLPLPRGETGEVSVLFHPPASNQVRAGLFAFGIRITPNADDDLLPIVVEGDVAVGALHALEVKLVPIRSRGRLRGRYRLDLHNRGTEAIRVELKPSDGEDFRRMQFALGREVVTLAPQSNAESFLRVRPDRVLPFGQPKAQPFEIKHYRRAMQRTTVTAGSDPDEEIEGTISGQYLQQPLISRWMIMLALLIALIVTLVVLWRIRTAPGELLRPPDPPAFGAQASSTGTATFSISAESRAVEANVVEIDCAFADLPLAPSQGGQQYELVAGAVRGQLEHERGPGEQLCLQARVKSPEDVWSQWAVLDPIEVDNPISFNWAQPTVNRVDAGFVRVEWPEPVTDFDPTSLSYTVLIDGQPAGGPIEGGVRMWANPDVLPGGTVLVQVRVDGPNGTTDISQSIEYTVEDTGPRPLVGYWIYFTHGPDGAEFQIERENIQLTLIGLEGGQALRDRLFPAVVDTDVVVPIETAIPAVAPDARPAAGDIILFLDGYETREEATATCLAFNRRKADPELLEVFQGTVRECVVVEPNS
ncbi:MAG: hypothetical protein AAF467_08430 [Actinomycetota bacterium]